MVPIPLSTAVSEAIAVAAAAAVAEAEAVAVVAAVAEAVSVAVAEAVAVAVGWLVGCTTFHCTQIVSYWPLIASEQEIFLPINSALMQ